MLKGNTITEVVSKDNPKLKLYRKLRSYKKTRYEENKFVIEGLRLCETGLHNTKAIDTLFLTDTAFATYYDSHCRTWIEESEHEIAVIRIADSLAPELADTENPQGIFAICNILSLRTLEDVLWQKGPYVVLCNLQDPGNLGTILRTADAFGIKNIITTQCCDPFQPKAVRATMGAVFSTSLTLCPDPVVLMQELQRHQIAVLATVPDRKAASVPRIRFGKKTSTWIGNEGNGLSTEILEGATKKITIPMQGNAESLNAAMAAGIILWEMSKGMLPK